MIHPYISLCNIKSDLMVGRVAHSPPNGHGPYTETINKEESSPVCFTD